MARAHREAVLDVLHRRCADSAVVRQTEMGEALVVRCKRSCQRFGTRVADVVAAQLKLTQDVIRSQCTRKRRRTAITDDVPPEIEREQRATVADFNETHRKPRRPRVSHAARVELEVEQRGGVRKNGGYGRDAGVLDRVAVQIHRRHARVRPHRFGERCRANGPNAALLENERRDRFAAAAASEALRERQRARVPNRLVRVVNSDAPLEIDGWRGAHSPKGKCAAVHKEERYAEV